MNDPEDQDMTRIKQVTDGLMGHFDSVHVFVTRHDAGEQAGTVNASWGAGNWFSRYGQIATWVKKEDARSEMQMKPDNDDAD